MIEDNFFIRKLKPFLQNKKRNYLILTQTFNALIGLISGKLIAEFIIPEQFGLYNLQFALFSFFFSLFIGPSIQFLKSTYFGLVQKIGFKYYLITFSWLSILMFFSVLFFFLVYKPEIYFNKYVILIIFFLIPLTAISNILLDQFNVFDKIDKYSIQTILGSFVGLLFLILFFYFFTGFSRNNIILWIMQLSSLAISVTFLIKNYKYIFKSSKIISYKLFLIKHFKFALPLMFLAIWSWLNSYFDRFVLEHFMTLSDVGIYNANYSLGSKFFLLLYPVFLVLMTPLVYSNNSIAYKKVIIIKYSKYYFILGILILILVFIFRNIIGAILLSNNYSKGFDLIFWISIAYLFITASYLFEMIFYVAHKTKVILLSNILCAIVSIVINVLLVQYIGLYGAVIAVISSALIKYLFIFYKFQKL